MGRCAWPPTTALVDLSSRTLILSLAMYRHEGGSSIRLAVFSKGSQEEGEKDECAGLSALAVVACACSNLSFQHVVASLLRFAICKHLSLPPRAFSRVASGFAFPPQRAPPTVATNTDAIPQQLHNFFKATYPTLVFDPAWLRDCWAYLKASLRRDARCWPGGEPLNPHERRSRLISQHVQLTN